MSSTTETTTTLRRTANTVLTDYQLHHSGPTASESDREKEPAQSTALQWDTTHRRVPTFRPVDRDRDLSEVRVFQNNAERAFIAVMFTGLFVNATVSKIWRATGGKINDHIFRYYVGGEY